MSTRPLVVALLVAIGVLAGFWSGDKVGSMRQSKAVAAAPLSGTAGGRAGQAAGAGALGGRGAFGGRGGAGGGSGRGGGAALYGQVVAAGPGDGNSNKDVRVALGKAPISRVTDAGPSDLTTNTPVTVFGQAGPDGTVNARAITIGTPPLRGAANG
jgi:hypothetical protein